MEILSCLRKAWYTTTSYGTRVSGVPLTADGTQNTNDLTITIYSGTNGTDIDTYLSVVETRVERAGSCLEVYI